MRLPRIRDLTEQQKKVYLYAPTDKHVLVHGPPGTGKTLIACLRAVELQKKNVPVVLGMFNRVLARYSSNAADGEPLPSQTVMLWFREWWKTSGLPPHPNSLKPLAVEVPFEQKERVKALGARWDARKIWRPWRRRSGAWMVEPDVYFANPGAFSDWRVWHEPPAQGDNEDSIDWAEVAAHILENEESMPDGALNLGALLIDEGQDFPPGFYRTLRGICAVAAARGARVRHAPRCFVLADENQQITEHNSTLAEIVEALGIAEDHRYLLLDNFRNSKEIAKLAASFFADVGAIPKFPDRRSERPVLHMVTKRDEAVELIRLWVTNNPGKEAGVLVFDDDSREKLTRALGESLASMRGRELTVQTYSWSTRRENKVDELLFDHPDVLTVLNMQSCKGLEFDAVFIIDPHKAHIGLHGPDRFRMQMFVAVSRAREWVNIIDTGPGSAPWLALLPDEDLLEREGPLRGTTRQPAGSATAPRREGTASGSPPRGSATSRRAAEGDWFDRLSAIAGELSLRVDDRRSAGGAVWVYGDRKLARVLEPLGMKYAQNRDGWWRK